MMPNCRWSLWAALAILPLTAGPVAASEAAKLLPADTDIVLTFHVRQFLNDHKKTEIVQDALNTWCNVVKIAGVNLDLREDFDRVTCGFRSGEDGFVAIVVEGKFQEEKLRATVKQLATQQGAAFKAVKVGGHEVWQVGDGGEHVALLNAKTLVITSDKKLIADVIARAAEPNKAGLSAGMEALLKRAEKQHVALAMKRVDVVVAEAVRILQNEIARQWKINEGVAKLVANQITAGLQKYGKEISTAGVGLTAGTDDVRVQLDLELSNAKLAKELKAAISSGTWWSALGLKAVDHELAQQLAEIVLKTRVAAKDSTLTLQVEVPYSFLLKAVQQSPFGNLLPADPKAPKAELPSALNHQVTEFLSRQVTSLHLWGPVQPQAPGALEVEEVRDVAYHSGPDADPIRHRLDLFVPKGAKNFPVVVVVHGGGWIIGDNRCCGLYSSVGHFLASQGIGAVLPNYRLSPWVKHPEHVKDLARAVAWTRQHIGERGGDPHRLFLFGHSAGGHLVSLLATDETYLKAEGLKVADLRGVISASGVYNIPSGCVEVGLGGSGPHGGGVDVMFPLRGDSGFPFDLPFPGCPVAVDVYGPVFGNDPKDRARASPLTHVRPGLPPFLILVAEKDLPTLSAMAEGFHKTLSHEGVAARLMKLPKRNHNSLIFSAIRPEDPAARAILEFVHKN